MFQIENQSVQQVGESFMSTAALLVLLQGSVPPPFLHRALMISLVFIFIKVFLYSLSITPSKVILPTLKNKNSNEMIKKYCQIAYLIINMFQPSTYKESVKSIHYAGKETKSEAGR